MNVLPIILLTYERTEYALRTIDGIYKHLTSDTVKWVVADDGSRQEHIDAVLAHIESWGTNHEPVWRSKRCSYGENANWAWGMASTVSPVSLWLEDDWFLRYPFDVSPYVKLLMDNEDVGMVRLGHMPIDLELYTCGFNGHMYARVEKSQQYAFSGNPHLKHERFRDYGWYPTGKNPGDTEIAYDGQIREQYGPSIWWPFLIGDNPPFAHIGQVQSY